MTLWSDAFNAGGFSGGIPSVDNPASGNFFDGDLSPERAVQMLSYATVVSDSDFADWIKTNKLRDRIEMTPIRNPFDFRQLPRVQCYLGSMTGDQVQTQLTLDEVRVYWAVRVAFNETMAELAFGEPSFDSLAHLIRRALLKNHSLTFRVNGIDCPLARRGFQDGQIDYLLDVDEVEDRRAVTLEQSWVYSVKTDTTTGRLASIVDAGG